MIFLAYGMKQNQPVDFNNKLSEIDPNIKLTVTIKKHVNYLDVTIINKQQKLYCKALFKSTDSYIILNKSSYHPPHVCIGSDCG